jgi:DnaJ-class molecular chaperone
LAAKDQAPGVESRVAALESQVAELKRRVSELEQLEVPCPVCKGTRFADGGRAPCQNCQGVGTILTPRGERVARLIQAPRDTND